MSTTDNSNALMQAHASPVVRVALDVPLNRLFDYVCHSPVQLGNRVVVPFAGRQLVGVVMDLPASSDFPIEKLKAVTQVFDDVPFDMASIALMQFCADYYHYPFGAIVLSALPLRLRQIKPATTRKTYRYRLSALAQAGVEIDKRQTVQQRIYEALIQQGAMQAEALVGVSTGWRKAMLNMQAQGWIEAEEVVAVKPSLTQSSHVPQLNDEQQLAVNLVLASQDSFKPWLLYGVTGSGKTEVYIRLLESILQAPQAQVLVMVPEINLTPQLEARFRSRLSQFPLVTLHSNLSESERLQHWQAAQTGAAKIIIGTRLSVLTPMPHLKMMILDEEHDSSYKQQDGMRYHARDVALVRAKQLNIPIVLGSATPSLETWHNAHEKELYGLLTLTQRAVAEANLPRIVCVDTTKSVPEAGISPILKQAITQRLARKEQSLLFINRRGYAPVLHCAACQWLADCQRCSAKMVLHLNQRRIRCHHCGDEQKIPTQCPSCGNPDLRPVGQATQRIEETLQQLFPQARIARVDRDSVQKKDSLVTLLTQVQNGEIDILVGTQMLAKGHDFANLTLVSVLDCDGALYSPDFRASERLFAQLMQVAGRAGRGEKAGEVLIQTAFPRHELFEALRQHDYTNYANHLLQERIVMQFPPAAYFAVFRAEAKAYAIVAQFLQSLADFARDRYPQVMVYDPIRPSMARLNGLERGQLLFQSPHRVVLQRLLQETVLFGQQHPLTTKLRWVLDVDPMEL